MGNLKSESTEKTQGFNKGHEQDDTRPGLTKHIKQRLSGVPSQLGDLIRWLTLATKEYGDHCKYGGIKQKGPGPEGLLCSQTTEDLTRGHANHLTDHEACKDILSLIIGNRIPDPGHGQRNGGGAKSAGRSTRNDEHGQRVSGQNAGQRRQGRECGGHAHDPQLATAVGERSVQELHQTVSRGERRNRPRSLPQRDAEVMFQARQQGVQHPRHAA